MITFYGTGLVWDKENNKLLCKFVDGKFETNDQRTANILINAGYEFEGEIEDEAQDSTGQATDLEQKTAAELKVIAEEKGIDIPARTKKEDIIALIRAGEQDADNDTQ
ncbi:hypothetical protein BHU72_11990 [Desulfuribacillus stibiiarsenatis]|uniref:Rho termination factor-like N-terminal domain-containing protein n=1 Tax=Desulfuribacillus stibiiarsenatis TaxID=1390249 RepID=A0A1E5L866_9FIRM|nr:Rho termination factor N-terminal domain-containing protein [Desulfuribacillus stibiiarsenatis]OEH86248.1 hypothetical protein BHU72_11990 [Desulfuribacillus stibiiarsenatis]